MRKSHPKVPIYYLGLQDITYTNSTALYIPANIISVVFFFNSSILSLSALFSFKNLLKKSIFSCDFKSLDFV